jgi:hypothetical protein
MLDNRIGSKVRHEPPERLGNGLDRTVPAAQQECSQVWRQTRQLIHAMVLLFYRFVRKRKRMGRSRVGGLAGIVGRAVSGLISDHLGHAVPQAFRETSRVSEPLLRSVVDAFLADKIATVTWPSVVVLGAIFSVHLLTLFAFSPETDRILVGLVVLAAFAWSAYGLTRGIQAFWPYARLWFVTLLPPMMHVRLLIFQFVREQHAAITAIEAGNGFKTDIMKAALEHFQDRNRLGPDLVAFKFANELAPVLIRHLLQRTAVLIGPMVCAFGYYRLVLYPDVIARFTTIGPWSISIYPVATLVDGVLGTHFRSALYSR